MTRTLNLLSMLMVVLFAGSLQAQIIATDDFEAATITDSKMSGGSGFDGDWILRGTAKTDFSIVEQSLQYARDTLRARETQPSDSREDGDLDEVKDA